jgi:hypothetical protein
MTCIAPPKILPGGSLLQSYPLPKAFLCQQEDLERTGLFFLEIIFRRAPTREEE